MRTGKKSGGRVVSGGQDNRYPPHPERTRTLLTDLCVRFNKSRCIGKKDGDWKRVYHGDTEGTEFHGEKGSEEREVRRTEPQGSQREGAKGAKRYAYALRSLRLLCALCGSVRSRSSLLASHSLFLRVPVVNFLIILSQNGPHFCLPHMEVTPAGRCSPRTGPIELPNRPLATLT